MLKSRIRIKDGKDGDVNFEEEEAKLEGEEHHPISELSVYTDRRLDSHEVSVRLSWLGKTAEGDGFIYLKTTCTDLKLTNIACLQLFTFLQFVDVSNNFLTLEALQVVTKLPNLTLLQADNNIIDSANLYRCKYLQVIIMNNNRITSIEDVFQPELSTLEVGYNAITEIIFMNRMPNIRVLDFRYNLISDISNIDFPNLDSLYLAGNKITELTGIHRLQNLRLLHVRNNPIRFLHGFEYELPRLEYLNLRNCKVGTLRQVKRLEAQPALMSLVLKGTPFMGGTGEEDPDAAKEEDDPEARVEVLAALPQLQRLNKTVFTDEEREEANDLIKQWLEEGEKEEEEEAIEEALGEEQSEP